MTDSTVHSDGERHDTEMKNLPPPAPRGRPPLAESERRADRLVFRVEKWRKAGWTKAAQNRQQTLIAFISELADREAEARGVKMRPPV